MHFCTHLQIKGILAKYSDHESTCLNSTWYTKMYLQCMQVRDLDLTKLQF